MSAYPDFSRNDLATYSGRPEVSYPVYADTAIQQATLLFKIGTCLAALPDDPDLLQLATNGILAMADSIVLAQQYQGIQASPFSSESIGSYSYTKAAKAVSAGADTGIMWFDLARNRLSVCDDGDGIPTSGGIHMTMGDGMYFDNGGGSGTFLSPGDINRSTQWGYDPNTPGWL